MLSKILSRIACGLAAGVVLLGVAGCGATDPEADKTARTAYAHAARGEDAALIAMMEPGVPAESTRANLSVIHQLIPPGPPPEGKAAGWRTYAGTGGVTTTLTHVYAYSDRDITVNTTLVKEGDPPKWWVRGVNINTNMRTAPPAPAGNATPAANAAAPPSKS